MGIRVLMTRITKKARGEVRKRGSGKERVVQAVSHLKTIANAAIATIPGKAEKPVANTGNQAAIVVGITVQMMMAGIKENQSILRLVHLLTISTGSKPPIAV